MSITRNKSQRPLPSNRTGLIWLLLSRRFDYPHRAWSLPLFDHPLEAQTQLPLLTRHLSTASLTVTNEFFAAGQPQDSIPKPAKTSSRRQRFKNREARSERQSHSVARHLLPDFPQTTNQNY